MFESVTINRVKNGFVVKGLLCPDAFMVYEFPEDQEGCESVLSRMFKDIAKKLASDLYGGDEIISVDVNVIDRSSL